MYGNNVGIHSDKKSKRKGAAAVNFQRVSECKQTYCDEVHQAAERLMALRDIAITAARALNHEPIGCHYWAATSARSHSHNQALLFGKCAF